MKKSERKKKHSQIVSFEKKGKSWKFAFNEWTWMNPIHSVLYCRLDINLWNMVSGAKEPQNRNSKLQCWEKCEKKEERERKKKMWM